MEDIYESLLDGLSELIYVSDPVTYQLLYLNKAGREVHGADVANGTHMCYEVLQGMDAPCPFCTNDRLAKDSFYEWEHTNPLNRRHYLLRDRLIVWKGQPARLEITFDVTERQAEKKALRFLLDVDKALLTCVKVLDSEKSLGSAFDEVLRILGEFFEADRAYMIEFSSDSLSSAREWCADGVPSKMEELQTLPTGGIDAWKELFSIGEALLVEDVEQLPSKGRAAEYNILVSRGIHTLVLAPLEVDGKLGGLIGMDNPTCSERLDILKTPLVGLAHFASSRINREVAQQKVAELTWSDPLTGACSRAAFHRDFDRGLFNRIGFLIADADRLAVVNRAQGRPAGDDVLRRIAATMMNVLGDQVYRIGDDEFCGTVVDVDYEQFTELANRVVEQFNAEKLPVSAGPAWSEQCENTTSLLDTAQDRMRLAKRGRHRAEDMGINLASDAAVRNLLRPGGAKKAASEGLLDIFLMPQVSAATGALMGAEALARYIDTANGACALPTSFILALEDMGEIADVDFFALSKACATVARWREEGNALVPLAVNFSRLTVSEPGFVERVAKVVRGFKLSPSLIEIEITESARERGSDLLCQVSDDLRARGFRVAIDDFGVDNANFSLFVQLDFDVLKMDQSLVWGIGLDERTVGAVRGLVNLCSDLGIESVAEGIETEEQREALREAGCTRLQGYLIGRPVSIDEFERIHLHRARRGKSSSIL